MAQPGLVVSSTFNMRNAEDCLPAIPEAGEGRAGFSAAGFTENTVL